MNSPWQDIRYSLRMLRKVPGFTAIAVITLAVGIGANTIMFSVADLLLFRTTKVKIRGPLICCDVRNLVFGGISRSAYLTIRDSNSVFSDLLAQDDGTTSVTLVHRDLARRVCAGFVSANYFSFLGVALVQGRGFLSEEELRGSAPVAVLSHRLWLRLGAEPEIVGNYLIINGVSLQVVGVAPEGFTGITLLGPDLWLPLGAWQPVCHRSLEQAGAGRASGDRGYPSSLRLVGRLKPGLRVAAAQARLQFLLPRLKEDHPRQWTSNSSLYLYQPPKLNIGAGEQERPVMVLISSVLMGVSMMVLLIACLNLANMISVQGVSRHREIAIRMAIGGGRLQVVRQLLVESLLLALLGGVFGLLLSFWGTRIITNWIGALQIPEMSSPLKVGLSVRVLGATLGFCLLATLLFGLKPALGLSRRDIVSDLKESSSAVFRPVGRRRGTLSTSCQIVLAVVLVMGAAMFTRSALQLAQPNPGLHLGNKLVIQIDPLSAGYDTIRSAQLCETLADRLGSLRGVEALGVSSSLAFGGGGAYSVCEYAQGEQGDGSRSPLAEHTAVFEVGRDYFAALELPLLQGRPFNRLDSAPDAEKVVIINENLARRLRPDGDVLGCWIQYGLLSQYTEPYRVVGVVPDVQSASEVKKTGAQTYRPMPPHQVGSYLYLRIADAGSIAVLTQRILAEIRGADRRVPILSIATLDQRLRDNPFVWLGGVWARLAAASGATALFLATLGVYAVKGYMVASRTPEIGIRKALGATRADIMRMILREGLIHVAVGLTVGLALGLCAVRVVASALYGVNAVDPLSIVVTIALLAFASLLAGYFPARRAAKVDPMVALRCE